jgi:hypothetical protein
MNNGTGKINHIMLFRLAYAVFTFLALSVAFVVWVNWWPFCPISFGKILLEDIHAHPGGTITYVANFVKYTDRVGTIQRFLVCRNQATQTIEAPSLADATTDDTSKRRKAVIPHNTIAPDVCKIRITIIYPYFGIRNVKAGFETPEFPVEK